MYSVAWDWEEAYRDVNVDDWPQEFYEGFDGEGSVEEQYASEAQWTFETALDERVCGRCAPLHGIIFSTSEIYENFPFAEQLDEDTFQVHLHEPQDPYCRCELIRVPGTEDSAQEEEGEGMVEGRGVPLQRIPGLIRAARSPQSLMRYGVRYGLRGTLGMVGLSMLAPFLLPLIMYGIVPLIQDFIQDQVRRQVEAELKRQREEEERLREAQYREIYREGTPD